MSNEIRWDGVTTGSTKYATIQRATDRKMLIAAGTSFEALTVANWATYAVTLTETPASSYFYIGTFPAVANGWYYVNFYKCAASTPAIGDRAARFLGQMYGWWNGTKFEPAGGDVAQVGGTAQTASDVGAFANAEHYTDGFIHLSSAGAAGTAYPLGNQNNPIDNMADALTVMAASKINRMITTGNRNLETSVISSKTLVGSGGAAGLIVNSTGYVQSSNLLDSYVRNGGEETGYLSYCLVSRGYVVGILSGLLVECTQFVNSIIMGTLKMRSTSGNNLGYFLNCQFGREDSGYDFGFLDGNSAHTGSRAAGITPVVNCGGKIKIQNWVPNSGTLEISGFNGSIEILSSCTGTIIVRGGSGVVLNSSASATVTYNGVAVPNGTTLNIPAKVSDASVIQAQTDKLAFDNISSVNYLKTTVYGFVGSLLTGTAAYLRAGFDYFFNVATPAKTMNDIGAGSGLTAQQTRDAMRLTTTFTGTCGIPDGTPVGGIIGIEWVSGNKFTNIKVGDTITVNGQSWTVATRTSDTHLALNVPAGYANGTYAFSFTVRSIDQQIFEGSSTVTGEVTLAASQPNYAPSKAGDAMTLTAGQRVKLAASQPDYVPAVAGNKMDIIDVPNATAITAIQAGLAKMAASCAELTTDPGANPELQKAIAWLYMYFRNVKTQSNTTQTLKNDAGSTVLSATMSDDGSVFTKGKFA